MSVENYLLEIPEERKAPFNKLRQTIVENIDSRFEEAYIYKMIGYVVPKRIFPDGYHCQPELPLPYINIANQKNFIALYHMGLYADPDLLEWFTNNYPDHAKRKLNMGKSCVRFKYMDDIPYPLIAELLSKQSLDDWINIYTKTIRK